MDITVYIGALVALFVIIDPIGMALIFHSLVNDNKRRARVAIKACLISSLLLILFGNFGELLLSKLAISIQAFKISGGILLFYTAFRMVTSSLHFAESGKNDDIAVFPLSIPLLAGPGSLTVCILLFSNTSSVDEQLSVFLAVISIFMLTCLLMIFSSKVKKLIGVTGDEILKRFLGMLLAALAIQFILDGLAVLISH